MESPSTWLGAIPLEAPCPNCSTGVVARRDGDHVALDHCDVCGGVGRVSIRSAECLQRFVRPLRRP